MLYGDVTSAITRAFQNVHNDLGYGFLEHVYDNAQFIACEKEPLHVSRQEPIEVFYEGFSVGTYRADMVVENLIIVEIRAAERTLPPHEALLTNCLRATEYEVGLLLNFGRVPEFKRKIFTNDRKKHFFGKLG